MVARGDSVVPSGEGNTYRGGVRGLSPLPGRIAYLDGIRAVAIMAVLGVHWVNPYIPVAPGGYIGVDIFFVLSGYIITRIVWRGALRTGTSTRKQYGHFLAQRLRRLYPALTGFIALGLGVVAISTPGVLAKSSTEGLIAGAQGMGIYLGLGGDGAVPFGHTWSLANEWFFYVVWPLALMWAARRQTKPKGAAAFALAVAAALYALSLATSPKWFYFGPTSRSAEILVGAAAALLVLAHPKARLSSATATYITAGGLVAAFLWTVFGASEFSILYRFVGFPVAVVAALSLIVPGAMSVPGTAIRVLSSSPVAYVGRISYSLYLWHLLPIQLLDKDDYPGVSLYAIGAIGVSLAIAMTLASYYLLEKPFMRSNVSALNQGSGTRDDSRTST